MVKLFGLRQGITQFVRCRRLAARGNVIQLALNRQKRRMCNVLRAYSLLFTAKRVFPLHKPAGQAVCLEDVFDSLQIELRRYIHHG